MFIKHVLTISLKILKNTESFSNNVIPTSMDCDSVVPHEITPGNVLLL